MSVKINIHKTHRAFTDGMDVVEVNGNNVDECLKDLINRFPGMKSNIFDKKGHLRNIVEIYLNFESAYPNELAKSVNDGDEIHLTVMLAGG
jgi:adenylyltransferase/sulfurtransferase